MKKKVLVVVAHPDDETIWMGGSLIRNKDNWNTTVISLCRSSDRDRAPKFRKACEILGVRGIILGMEDEKLNPLPIKDIIKNILDNSEKEYDIIFSHGKSGETGHIRHKEVHKAIIEILKKGFIKAKEVFFFSYLPRENDYQGYCIYNSSANKLIKLNSDEVSIKKNIQVKTYGYPKGGLEELSCGDIESFDILE